ncbi:MAG: class I SAM-dependent methyltransferase, partial [Lysobacterales bacterium]
TQYERAKRSVDFIQRYIFPGSNLTSVGAMTRSIATRTDLQLMALEDIGLHYAQTLRDWRRNFLLKLPEVRAMDYPEAFIRMWEYYFCYCEGGFLERAISDVHLQARKPHT